MAEGGGQREDHFGFGIAPARLALLAWRAWNCEFSEMQRSQEIENCELRTCPVEFRLWRTRRRRDSTGLRIVKGRGPQ